MSKLEKIVEDLSSLTVLEAADLAKLLEEKWGVSAAAPVAVAAAGGGGGAAAPVAEAQTEFSIILKEAGGHASNGGVPILDIPIQGLQQKSQFIGGSRAEEPAAEPRP